MTHIFVPAIGQFDNIGDSILRRPLLDKLRQLGVLHIYLGAAPVSFEESLHLDPDDTVYRSFRDWYRELLRRRDSPVHYAFKPGEIQLTLRGMKEHWAMIPGLIILRTRGGRVVRVGSGARQLSRRGRALMRPSLALTDLTIWRDKATADFLGGEVMADLGFLDGLDPAADRRRNLLIISLRGDRPFPDPVWLETMREVALRLELEVAIVTQVARDDSRTRELSRALGGLELGWDGQDLVSQERELRDAYSRASLVVSDRLHVLIAAASEGAAIVAATPAANEKIHRHLSAAGYPPLEVPIGDKSAGESAAEIVALAASTDYPGALRLARASAHSALARVGTTLS